MIMKDEEHLKPIKWQYCIIVRLIQVLHKPLVYLLGLVVHECSLNC